MKPLNAALDYVKREPWTVFMVVVLTTVMAVGWIGARTAPLQEADGQAALQQDIHSEAERLATTQRIEDWGNRAAQDPRLRMILSGGLVLIVAVTGLGLIWGVALLGSLRRGERWMDRFGSPRVSWGLNEAFKAVVLLFFLDLVFSSALAYVFTLAGAQTTNTALITGSLLRSVVVLLYLRRTARRFGAGWSDLGICLHRPGKQVLWGLAGYLAMIPVYLLVLGVLVSLLSLFHLKTPVQTPVQILYTETNTAAVMGFALFMGILGPWFEEIFFRGFLYPVFKNRVGVFRGTLAASVLFAALHGHGIAFAPILVLGLALNVLYERSGSILPGAVLHMTHNCAMLALTLVIRQAAA